jgi:hypothetical protein
MEIDSYKRKSYVPTHIMTLYSEDNLTFGEKYLEISEIIPNPKKAEKSKPYIIVNTAPADGMFLRDLVSSIKAENFDALQFKSIIPSNILYFKSVDETPSIVWYRESELRMLHFKEDMGIKSGNYIMPKVIFMLRDNDLSVFRITDEVITEKTALYLLPLPNIHDDSTVCLGNAKRNRQSKCLEDVILKYEELFYQTRFNVFHNDEYFPKDINISELTMNPDIRQWPIKLSDTKTLKALLNEISPNK